MNVVWSPGGDVARLVADLIAADHGSPIDFGECQTAAIVSGDGKFAAGVVFHNWESDARVIEMSAAAIDKRWLLGSTIPDLFAYAFNVARMVVVRTRERNRTMQRVMRKLGASEFRIPELFRQGEALFLYTLTLEQFQQSELLHGRHTQAEKP